MQTKFKMQQQHFKTIEDILIAMNHARKTIEHCENLLQSTFQQMSLSQVSQTPLAPLSFFQPSPPNYPAPPEAFKNSSLPPLPQLPQLPQMTTFSSSASSAIEPTKYLPTKLSSLSPSFEISSGFDGSGLNNTGFDGSGMSGSGVSGLHLSNIPTITNFKSILFPQKDLSTPTKFLEIINNEVSQSSNKVFYSSELPKDEFGTDESMISTPLKKIKKHFKNDKFQQNIIRILLNEFTNAKLEKRDVIPLLPPNLKSLLDPENMPPKKSPHNESFTSLISKIKEVQMIWIRRNSSKDETLLEPERAYVLSPSFIANWLS